MRRKNNCTPQFKFRQEFGRSNNCLCTAKTTQLYLCTALPK